jgi:hypothetical protein
MSEEQVRLIYPNCKLQNGWARVFGSLIKVRGIKIGNRWLVHDGYRGCNTDQKIWEKAWRVIGIKMLRKFES